MKIVYIALKGMPLGGGIEKYTEEIGSRLAGKGHDIIVYTMRHYGNGDEIYKGMRIKTVPCINMRAAEKLSASFMASLAQCLEKDVDIVHFHHSASAVFSFIPLLQGRRVVATSHSLEWRSTRWNPAGRLLLRLLEYPMAFFPHLLTVVSKEQQRYFRDKFKRDCVYIPPGVDSPSRRPPERIRQYGLRGNDYILFVGRLVREKGAHYLIEAYNRLGTDMKLVIAGDAKYEEEYRAELSRMAGEGNKIIFTGFVTGELLRELYSNCYLFVLPSEREGLPTALLEAMSYGNCCLVSDIPGSIEALGSCGYTFRSRDTQDLHDKLNRLIRERDAVESVKKAAEARALADYMWDAIAIEFERQYSMLLAKKDC